MGKILELYPSRKSESNKQFIENLKINSFENKYNMERVSREKLIQLGFEDDRNEFDKRRDKLEAEKFSKDLDELIYFIETHPID